MSDNRLSVTDGCSLCKCPVGGNAPPAGRFLFARRGSGLFVGGKVVCLCGWY